MAINAGDVVWNIGADVTKLNKALDKASVGAKNLGAKFAKHSKAIGAGMTAAGAVITATLGKTIKDFTTAGDAVQKMAIRTGASTEAISELGFAAEQSGASMETIGKAFKAQADFLEDAKDGLSTSTDALDKLGISVGELEGLNPEQLFMTLSSAIGGVADPIQRAALANDVFKRSGQELIPLFAAGAEGIAGYRAEAVELGRSMSQEQADSAAKLADGMNSLKSSLMGIGIEIGSVLVPILSEFVPKITEVVTSVSNWMKANPGLSKTVLIIAGAVGGLLTFLGPLLIVLPGLATVFGIVSTVAGVVAGAIAAVSAPVLLIGAGIAALAVIVVKNWNTIKGAIMGAVDAVVGVLKNLWFTVSNVFSSISNFITQKTGISINAILSMLGPIGKVISALSDLLGMQSKAKGFASGGVVPGMATGGVVKGYASGGATDARLITVGERGRELLAAPVGSRVLSHPDMMKAARQGSGGGNIINMNATFAVDAKGIQNPEAFFERMKPSVNNWLLDGLRQATI